MKLQRIVIRKARKTMPRIPDARDGETYILFKVRERKVVDRQLFIAHREAGGICIHGFTHYALLPTYISP